MNKLDKAPIIKKNMSQDEKIKRAGEIITYGLDGEIIYYKSADGQDEYEATIK